MTTVMTLRIASTILHPLVFNCSRDKLIPHKNCSYPGADAEILGSILSILSTPYKILSPEKEALFGSYANGSWNGLLGLVYNGTVDTILPALIQITERTDHFDFSFPIHQSSPVMIVKRSGVSFLHSAVFIFQTFSWNLWFGTVLFILTLFMGLTVLHRVSKSKRKFDSRFSLKQLCESFQQVTSRYGRMEITSTSGHILTICLGALAVLMMGLYQGSLLTTLLLVPASTYPFKNSEQLVEMIAAKKYHLITTDADQWYIREMYYSNLSYFKHLKRAVTINPFIVEPNTTKALEMVKNGPYILPEESRRANYIIQDHCDLVAVNSYDGIPEQWLGFIFRKGSPWLSLFEKNMVKLQEHTNYINQKYNRFTQHCYTTERLGVQSISLTSLTGLFVMLVFSMIVGSGLLLAEINFANGHHREERVHRKFGVISRDVKFPSTRRYRFEQLARSTFSTLRNRSNSMPNRK